MSPHHQFEILKQCVAWVCKQQYCSGQVYTLSILQDNINSLMLDDYTKVRIIKPERELEYYEEHVTQYFGYIGNVVSIRGYTRTVRINSGDSEVHIPIHGDALEVVNV